MKTKVIVSLLAMASSFSAFSEERICLESEKFHMKLNLFLNPISGSAIKSEGIKKLYRASGVSHFDFPDMTDFQVNGTASKNDDGSYVMDFVSISMQPKPNGGGAIQRNTTIQVNLDATKNGSANLFSRVNGPDFEPGVFGAYDVAVYPIKCKDY